MQCFSLYVIRCVFSSDLGHFCDASDFYIKTFTEEMGKWMMAVSEILSVCIARYKRSQIYDVSVQIKLEGSHFNILTCCRTQEHEKCN